MSAKNTQGVNYARLMAIYILIWITFLIKAYDIKINKICIGIIFCSQYCVVKCHTLRVNLYIKINFSLRAYM